MKNSGVFTIFSPLAVSALMAASWIWPSWFYPSLTLGSFLILWSCYLFYQNGVDNRYWKMALPPLFYLLASSAYLTVISSRLLVWLTMALLLVIMIDYLRAAYFFINDKNSFSAKERWANIALSVNILSFFWGAAALFNLQSFLSLSSWSVIAISTVVCFLLSRQWLSSKELSAGEVNSISALMAVLGLEVSFSLSLLPFAHYVLALMFTIIYHFSLQLSWRFVSQTLSPRRLKLYLLVSIAGLLVLVFSAHWL